MACARLRRARLVGALSRRVRRRRRQRPRRQLRRAPRLDFFTRGQHDGYGGRGPHGVAGILDHELKRRFPRVGAAGCSEKQRRVPPASTTAATAACFSIRSISTDRSRDFQRHPGHVVGNSSRHRPADAASRGAPRPPWTAGRSGEARSGRRGNSMTRWTSSVLFGPCPRDT